MRAMQALGDADSVTIDPHKLGYVPYPAGAFLLKERGARELVATAPPYLAPTTGLASADDLYLGRYILEGSKPGAAAAAVWLSHKVLPLNEKGYGHLIEQTAAGAHRLYDALSTANLAPFRVVLLPRPDINILCYVVHHPSLGALDSVNAFNERIHALMSLEIAGGTPEYIISRTRFQTPMYDGAIGPLLRALGVCTESEWKDAGNDGLVVLRSTVMDPFLVAPPPAPDHVAGFIAALRRACTTALAASS
jgi:tyrosine decarboxylase